MHNHHLGDPGLIKSEATSCLFNTDAAESAHRADSTDLIVIDNTEPLQDLLLSSSWFMVHKPQPFNVHSSSVAQVY